MILRRGNIPWIILFALMLAFVVWLLSNMAGQIFITSVIWVFVALVLFGVVTFVALRKTAEGVKDFCPKCGEDVDKGTATCPNCGHDMSDEGKEEPESGERGSDRDRDEAQVG
jgi:hypothetical protein